MSQGEKGVTLITSAGAEPGGLPALSKPGWEEGPIRRDVFKEMGGGLAVSTAGAGPGRGRPRRT